MLRLEQSFNILSSSNENSLCTYFINDERCYCSEKKNYHHNDSWIIQRNAKTVVF